MLESYLGEGATEWQQMNMWVFEDADRFETTNLNEATEMCDKYRERNPGGIYSVKVIEEENV